MAVIKNVKISWVKCDENNPDMGFDGDSPAWKVNIENPSDALVQMWKDKGLGGLKKTKDTGAPYLVVQRKATKYKNGDSKEAPSVVDGHLKPLDPNIVGNGSIANIQYSTYPWTFKNKEGVAADLMGIQVLNLIMREGVGMEFEMVDDDAVADADPFTAEDDKDIY